MDLKVISFNSFSLSSLIDLKTRFANRVLKCDVTKYIFLGYHKVYCKF